MGKALGGSLYKNGKIVNRHFIYEKQTANCRKILKSIQAFILQRYYEYALFMCICKGKRSEGQIYQLFTMITEK